MAFFCTHCGSRNHRALDCSKKHLTYTPTATELAEMAAPAAQPSPAPSQPANLPPVPPNKPQAGPIVLEPPRWPGGPKHCPLANLGAFTTQGEAKAFADSLCANVLRTWECRCGHWHIECKPHAPAGGSSGNERDSKLPPNFKPFIRQSFLAQIRKAHGLPPQGELPKQPARPAAAPAKKIVAPPPAQAVKCGQQQDTFL